MEILYVSALRSEKRFAELLRDQPIKPPQQVQKFHGLLARGLASFARGLTALSTIPNPADKLGIPSVTSESEAGISYRYLSLRMIPIFSHLVVFTWSFFSCLRWRLSKPGRDHYVVCDVLDLSITAGTLLASKVLRTQSIAIVTDIPDYMHGHTTQQGGALNKFIIHAYLNLSTYLMERYDGYVLLTEAMNPVVNPKGRPHLVMEGMVDHCMGTVTNTLEDKYAEPVVIYAGALYTKYGVATLLDAFLKIPLKEARLWIYGAGELEDRIQACAVQDPRIKFWGVRPNAEVVEAEVRATLLINPRPSDEAFTKYSFPSKNMEYMASGTPVLTANLPGMPPEYLEHVYTLHDESVDGLAATLTDLLSRPTEELHRLGDSAKTFALTQKNNVVQAGRVHAFLQSLGQVSEPLPERT